MIFLADRDTKVSRGLPNYFEKGSEREKRRLTDNFTFAGNYVQSKKNRASVMSIEGDLALTPELAISGEYADSSLEEGEAGSSKDGAF